MLPIALGEATKLAGRMLDATKAYDFTIRFGEETDTLDAEGQVVATSDVRPTLAQVEAVLPRFTGEIEQVPPSYSALKIDGKAAYARARAGEQVEIKPRQVTVHSLGNRKSSRKRGSAPQAVRISLRNEKSRSPPPFPRAPTSATSPATSPGRLERSVMFPILGAHAPGRSVSNRPFRWTF